MRVYTMAKAIRGDQLRGVRVEGYHRVDEHHRVDQIGVHPKPRAQPWWLLALLPLAALLLFMAFGRRTAPPQPVVDLPERPRAEPPRPAPAVAPPTQAREQAAACPETSINFANNRSDLDAASRLQLNQLASCLKANPGRSVRLVGRANPTESG